MNKYVSCLVAYVDTKFTDLYAFMRAEFQSIRDDIKERFDISAQNQLVTYKLVENRFNSISTVTSSAAAASVAVVEGVDQKVTPVKKEKDLTATQIFAAFDRSLPPLSDTLFSL